jgi:GT2 family glycosyltransferase
VLQGRTAPDPHEQTTLIAAAWSRTVLTDPPTAWAESCNIAYPRALLERINGFQPEMRMGEDTDLWLRAQRAGATLVAVPEMLVYHAVHEERLLAAMRSASRWRDIAWLAKRHPVARRQMWGRIWWKREHAALCCALGGVGLARRHRAASALTAPWLALSLRHRGYGARGIARSLTELPGRALIDAAEIVTMTSGSVRFRTILL